MADSRAGGAEASRLADDGRPQFDIAQLVAEHADALYRYAFRLTSRAADAEDLTQQTYLIAHRKIEQLRDPRSARFWLMAIMRRAYCRLYGKRNAEREKFAAIDIDTLPAEEMSDAGEIDQESLQSAIDELPNRYKFILLGFYFENLSYREMAEQFRLPIGTVMSRLARAKAHLRRALFDGELQGVGGKDVDLPQGDAR